jgi:hypothetical protein
MSNVSHAWSRNLQSVEGALNALARVMNDREAISARILSIGEKVTDPIDNADGGELLCLVLAIVTSAALVDEKISPDLAILSESLTAIERTTLMSQSSTKSAG